MKMILIQHERDEREMKKLPAPILIVAVVLVFM